MFISGGDKMKVLTTKEVAELLKVNKRTALNLISSGDIKGRKIGRGYRVLKKEVEKFMSDGFDTKQEYNYKNESKTRPDVSQEPQAQVTDDIKDKTQEAVESIEIVADDKDDKDDKEIEYISTDEAAKMVGVSRRTIQHRLRIGKLAGKKDGRKWLAKKSMVETYARAKKGEEKGVNNDE